MSIKDLTDEGLQNTENNYRKAGLEVGGKYSLAELLLEKKRRNSGPLEAAEVYKAICRLSARSPDGLVTYGQIWSEFYPEKPWAGNYSQTMVGKALDGVIYHCHKNGFPLMNVLVVRKSSRRLSKEAFENIWNECKEIGLDTGLDMEGYVSSHVASAIEHAKASVNAL